MRVIEEAFVFPSRGERLSAILHRPAVAGRRAVLIVVGGPQYRVGSHRQFLLLARSLASRGYPVLRFDYRGMGDSEGEHTSFEDVGPDIANAVDVLVERVEEVEDVVIWGLCDAASAALLYVPADQRIKGLVLANPWVRSEATLAKTYLKHYYRDRLLDRQWWKRLLFGKVNVFTSLADFARSIVRGVFSSRQASEGTAALSNKPEFTEGMLTGLQNFSGQVLFILSGDDLTAQEFKDLSVASSEWSNELNRDRVNIRRFDEHNHTFSRDKWRTQISDCTSEWLQSW